MELKSDDDAAQKILLDAHQSWAQFAKGAVKKCGFYFKPEWVERLQNILTAGRGRDDGDTKSPRA